MRGPETQSSRSGRGARAGPGEGQRGRGLSLQDDQGDDIADVLDQLHAGVVTGSSGENMIRAEIATCAEAWRRALDRAVAGGMLPGWPRPAV